MEQPKEVNLSKVFFDIVQAYQAGTKLIILQGGQGSSKTISALQFVYMYMQKHRDARATVASYALPHLKAGAMADFDRIVLPSFGENADAIKNRSESLYFLNQGVIDFYGIEGNIAKAHGPRRDLLYINEVNRRVSYDVYDLLASRTSDVVIVDYNPSQEFWLHEKVLPNFPNRLIKSTFRDNPWLPQRELQNILAKYGKAGFENWWKVYGEGELGKLEGAIFPNWRHGAFDTSLPHANGLDFGFNAPDAMVRCAIDTKRKIMYWAEQLYLDGLTPTQLEDSIAARCTRNDLIIADCADARMIKTLGRRFNIKPVNKKLMTIPEALRLMQDYEHVLTEDSPNLEKEFNNYIWSDKKAGVPIDAFNHLIDAGRYYFMTMLKGGGTQQWHG
jgi:phage terminase large subunit